MLKNFTVSQDIKKIIMLRENNSNKIFGTCFLFIYMIEMEKILFSFSYYIFS